MDGLPHFLLAIRIDPYILDTWAAVRPPRNYNIEDNMDKQISITERNVYGETRFYPACDTSRLLCEVAGTKQVTASIIAICKANGFRVTVAPVAPREI